MQTIRNDRGFKMTEVWGRWFLLVGLAAGVLLGFNRPTRAIAIQSDIDALVRQSRFIFRGTVKKLNAATFNGTPNSGMVAVLVDEVLQAPEEYLQVTGIKVTVKLKEPDSVKIGQQLIFFTNLSNSPRIRDLTDLIIFPTIGDGLAVTEVGRMEAPASSDILRQQIAAAKQRPTGEELEQRLAQNVEDVKSLLIGIIKKYNKMEGCGCYFKTLEAAQKEYWQDAGPYVFVAHEDDIVVMNIDGKDIELQLVKSNRNPDPDYKDKVGDKYREIYRAGDIMVYLNYVVTEVCGPKSPKYCEWEEADGTVTIQRGERKQTIKVRGGCGC
jgi:hypothetical protein